jgi:hypothetical protein
LSFFLGALAVFFGLFLSMNKTSEAPAGPEAFDVLLKQLEVGCNWGPLQ